MVPLTPGTPRGVVDNDEFFDFVIYDVHDSDNDARNDSVRVSFGVLTDGVSEQVRVNMTVTNDTGAVMKGDMMEFVARRRGANLTQTYFDFKTGKTGIYNIELELYDRNHGKTEDSSNMTNTTLYFNSGRYDIEITTVVDDFNGNGTPNDVLIRCTDEASLPVSNATVLIDGWYRGSTDGRGKLFLYNLSGQHHEADAFYSEYHANTDFEIAQRMPDPLIADPEPMDLDGDGYHDDLRVYARLPDSSPAMGAMVRVGSWLIGFIGIGGYAEFDNLTGGDYDVTVTYQAPRREITAYSYFYSEAAPITEYDMFFYYINAETFSAHGDGKTDDLSIYCDVDISDGVTARVNINATVFDEWASVAAFTNTSYVTTGADVEGEYMYVYNLTEGIFTVRYELFDVNRTLRDVVTQTEVTIAGNDTPINVDKMVDDMDGGNALNDVVFYAHTKDTPRENITLRIYFSSNDTEYNMSRTDSWGMLYLYDLPEADYHFRAYIESGKMVEYGNFTIYSRFPRTIQTMEFLTDWDWDGYHDDFAIYAYDDQGLPDINTFVTVTDEDGWIVRQGWTRGGDSGPGYFIAENLWEGDYTFTAVYDNQIFQKNISAGIFHSHREWNDYYLPLFIDVTVSDANNSGYRDDVIIRVNDTNGVGAESTYVTIYNEYIQLHDHTDDNGTIKFHNLPGGHFEIVAEDYIAEPPARGSSSFNSQGPVALRFSDHSYYHISTLHKDYRRNDISIYSYMLSSADGWENITVEMNLSFENGTVHVSENSTFLGNSMNRDHYGLYDLPYANYSIQLRLFDANNTLKDVLNYSGLVLFRAAPVINTVVDYRYLLKLVPRFVDRTSFYSIFNFTLSNSTGHVNTSYNSERWYEGLDPDLYRWSIRNESLNITDRGEILVGFNYSLYTQLWDLDRDGYFDDFFLLTELRNGTPVDDAVVDIYDANGLPFTSGNPNNGLFELYNLSIGNYSYVLTHKQKTLMSGVFYSYTNGFNNHPPTPVISHPRNGSSYLTSSKVYFDGRNSTDIDVNDTIHFTWLSDRDGILSHSGNFNMSILSNGTHMITLFCDDGHGNNASMSIEIAILLENVLPSADAGPDRTVYINEPVEFLGSGADGDGSLVYFEWDFDGDGAFDWASDENGPVFHTYATVGVFYPVFRVKDDRGGLASDACNITVAYRNRPPIPDAGDDQEGYSGEMITLDGTDSRDPDAEYGDMVDAYNWTCVSHDIVLDERDTANPFFTPDEAGSYEFTLIVRDSNGIWSEISDTVNVTIIEWINLVPVADAGMDRAGYVGDTFVLDAGGSHDQDGIIIGYEWKCTNHNDVVLEDPDAIEATFIPEEEGTFTFSLRVMDDGGAWSETDLVNITVTEEIEVNLPPSVKVSPVSEAKVYESVRFSGEGSFDPNDDENGNGRIDGKEKDELRYAWDVNGDGKTDVTGKVASYIYTVSGTYQVTLTAEDDGGLDDHDNFTIVVKPENDPPVARIDQTGRPVFNEDDPIYLSAYSSYDIQEDENGDGELSPEESMGLTFHWDRDIASDSDGNGDPGDDSDMVDVEFKVRYSRFGEYEVGLIVMDGEGLHDRVTRKIIINSPPRDAVITVSASTENFYPTQFIEFSGECTDIDGEEKDLEYIWDVDSNGVPDGYGQVTEFAFETSGSHQITLRVEDRYGVGVEATTTVRIVPSLEFTLEAPYILSPADGVRITDGNIEVRAEAEDEEILWLEASISGGKWWRMKQESDYWVYTFNVDVSPDIKIYVRGVAKDFSGRKIYVESDPVSVAVGEGADVADKKLRSWEDYKLEMGMGAGFLILIMVLIFVIQLRRGPDREAMIREMLKKEEEKDRRARKKAKKREKELEKEQEDEDEIEVAEVVEEDPARGEEDDVDEEEEKEEEETGEDLDIMCPKCEDEFTAVATGKWPLMTRCPGCKAKGRITEKMWEMAKN